MNILRGPLALFNLILTASHVMAQDHPDRDVFFGQTARRESLVESANRELTSTLDFCVRNVFDWTDSRKKSV